MLPLFAVEFSTTTAP